MMSLPATDGDSCATTSDCRGTSSTTISTSRTLLGDNEVDILLRKAGLTVATRDAATPGGDGVRDIADTECRVGQCRLPSCAQKLATVRTFTAMCCTLAALTGALTAGYVNSVITTIEKRFEIGSSYSGLIAASVEIGGVMSAIVVSYLGSQRHIPNWIGFGALITSFGTLVFTVPHMMAPAYTVTGGINSSAMSESMCRFGRHVDDYFGSSVDVTEKCLSRESGQLNHVLTLVIAQLLIGIGGSPLYTLGTTYIDNHVSKCIAPSYIAFIYAFAVFGPLLGFALGALMLQYYVDLLSFDTVVLKLNSSNPRWVGAWWAGFIFIGGVLFLVSLPFFGFPRLLIRELRELVREDPRRLDAMIVERTGGLCRRSSGATSSTQNTSTAYGKSIRDFPRAVWHLLTNPVYIVTCFGICCEVSIVSGFVVFLPKYLETQFGATKSAASLLTGSCAIPGAVIGILVGGYFLRRLQLTRKGAIKFTLILNCIAILGFGLFFIFGCDNIKMAGVTVPYYKSITNTSQQFQYGHQPINLTSACNSACLCSNNHLEPVCGSDYLTYFSPCHAGCMRLHSSGVVNHIEHIQNYSSCECVARSLISRQLEAVSSTMVAASSGVCSGQCTTLLPFMILLFVMTFLIAATQMPLLMVTMRSVDDEEKAFALGVQFVMLRIFAYIPSPIMYGNIIDSTCIFWSEQCGYNGNCLLYDLVFLRYKYIGLSFGLKVLAALFYSCIWLLLHRRPGDDIYLTSICQQVSSRRVDISVVSAPISNESVPCVQLSVKSGSNAVDVGSPMGALPSNSECSI